MNNSGTIEKGTEYENIDGYYSAEPPYIRAHDLGDWDYYYRDVSKDIVISIDKMGSEKIAKVFKLHN